MHDTASITTFDLVRVFPDADGETHFEDVSISWDNAEELLTKTGWASYELAAERPFIKQSPPGVAMSWHNSGYRMLVFQTGGVREAEVSDGEVRQFGPGSVLLFEDTTGRGHQTRSVGAEPVTFLVLALPEEGLSW